MASLNLQLKVGMVLMEERQYHVHISAGGPFCR
jgi:hypothetical protein